MVKLNDIQKIRLNKLNNHPETYDFHKTIELGQLKNVEPGTEEYSICGRVIFCRNMGKLIFAKLYDITGVFQISISKTVYENIDDVTNWLDLGDIIGIKGFIYKTQTDELTLQTTHIQLIKKSVFPLPDKTDGLSGEAAIRLRYIDIIRNEEQRNILLSRTKVIKALRNYLDQREFLEVETPILQTIPSGAIATPFQTHYNALNLDVYLRIAPELFLKRLLVGGYNKVYELGKCFRNEGIDTTHLQEFTMLEVYEVCISYEDLMSLAIQLLQTVVGVFSADLIFNNLNFRNIKRITYEEFLGQYMDIKQVNDMDYLKHVATENNLEHNLQNPQALLDFLYKKLAVGNVTDPVLVYDYPLSPLSLPKNDNTAYQFQIIVNAQEVIKSCLELNNPMAQEQNFIDQQTIGNTGETEIARHDHEFINALYYGMPSAGGIGLGLDRIIAILCNKSIRNVIGFPMIKPVE